MIVPAIQNPLSKYNTMQDTATHCNTLQHTATHCNTSQNHCNTHTDSKHYVTMIVPTHQNPLLFCITQQHTAASNVLWRRNEHTHHTATRCNTLQHTVRHCSTLQDTASHCITLQHTATRFNTMQFTATHCNTLQARCRTLHMCCKHIATHSCALLYITKYCWSAWEL